MKNALLFAIAIIIAGSAGYATQKYLSNEEKLTVAIGGEMTDKPRPEFAIRDIEGNIRNIREWDDKVVLLNFWATWCPPCMKEIPHFIELQEEYAAEGLQIVGVALDDAESVSAFALDIGINYPVMAADHEGIELAKRYGNGYGALPYSVVIDRKGVIRSTIAGELSKEQALKLLKAAGLDA